MESPIEIQYLARKRGGLCLSDLYINNKSKLWWQCVEAGSPVYLHDSDRSHFFVRTGNGTRELDIPEELDYIEENLNGR
ncbi:hypothetical protein [Echinicola vietnamensis]|uniref:Uncharacterized protein n=1 Tax=Echinicola vietnamensis (strain DSM 17526 / LMG 23754 / KMM 6221) TaxID=926556 RepID=L0G5M7_ECHVK|nr:hypothetical protein [Echinicola vietnamensis]AGA80316.1 hypothetical protein Echvi_4114 [Echinicola vietnamensis DSM 17526]